MKISHHLLVIIQYLVELSCKHFRTIIAETNIALAAGLEQARSTMTIKSWARLKAVLHGQLYLPAPCLPLTPCLPSTADKNGDAFTRQTCDLNKYSCDELSCVGEEFRVQRQYVSGC